MESYFLAIPLFRILLFAPDSTSFSHKVLSLSLSLCSLGLLSPGVLLIHRRLFAVGHDYSRFFHPFHPLRIKFCTWKLRNNATRLSHSTVPSINWTKPCKLKICTLLPHDFLSVVKVSARKSVLISRVASVGDNSLRKKWRQRIEFSKISRGFARHHFPFPPQWSSGKILFLSP